MKVKELKELLNDYNEDFNIYVRNSNGALETNTIRIVHNVLKDKNSYYIEG